MSAPRPAGSPPGASPAGAPAVGAPAVGAPAVRELTGLDELRLVDGLFAAIWGGDAHQVGMPVNLLRALVHSGNYVAGAWRGDALVGAAVAFLGTHDGRPELHSHVAGVAPTAQGTGVGRALKCHQRDWARRRGIGCITWTYDPLMRRNGWFNLVVLGATATEYHPDFYGPMVDELNGTDETDRCLVRWDTGEAASRGPAEPAGAVPLLEADADGGPVRRPPGAAGGRPLLCQVPPDVVALRGADPGRAREWRLALRETMGAAMAAGYRAVGMTPSGAYLLEAGPS